jgi:hypothetical protein
MGIILLALIVAILWLRRSRRNARREAEEAEPKVATPPLAAQVRPSAEEPLEYYGGLVQGNDFEMANNGDANSRR